jgi:hypothetical protein
MRKYLGSGQEFRAWALQLEANGISVLVYCLSFNLLILGTNVAEWLTHTDGVAEFCQCVIVILSLDGYMEQKANILLPDGLNSIKACD